MLLSRISRNLEINTRLLQCKRWNSVDQVEYLKSALNSTSHDWTDIKQNLLKRRGNYNEKNIDAMMLKIMVKNDHFDAAFKFGDYIKSQSTELSIGATNGLLILYYEYSKKHKLSNEAKNFILNTYETLYKKYEVLDYSTGENLLHALSAVGEWEKCKKVLEDIKVTGTPTHSAYSSLIGMLFKLNKKAEAMKMITISVNDRRPLQDYAYEEWIKYIFRKYKETKTILKYLEEICSHIANTGNPVTKITADKIKEAFSSLQWVTKDTQILRKSGECTTCHERLACLKLTDEEFALLKKNVQDKLIVGSDLFLKSSPEELERFQKFVKQTAPYDIVIDALNVSYIANKNIKDRMQLLKYVVNHFKHKNMKILVLGRKHMMKWYGLEYVMKRSLTFFTDDLSQDDPYFITAAILSGPHTDIVSRDLLRGHRFMLQRDDIRTIFQRWQWQHQWKVFNNVKGPAIQSPLQFTPCAQKTSGVWHIPYEVESEPLEGKLNDGIPDCSTWLCLQPKAKS